MGDKDRTPNEANSNQTNSNQANPIQTNSNQANSNQTNSNQANSNQTNSNQANSNQTNSNQANPIQTNSNQANSNQTNSNQANSNQTNSNQANSNQTNSNQANSNQTNSNQANSNQTNSNQANSNQTNSNQANSNETNSNQAASNPTTSNQGTSNQRRINERIASVTTPNENASDQSPENENQETTHRVILQQSRSDLVIFNSSILNPRRGASHMNEEVELDADLVEDVLFYVSGTEGDMGLYQKCLFMLMTPFAAFFAWVYFVQFFITVAPEKYWCKVPELASLSMEVRRNLSAPGAATGQWDSCHTFNTDWNEVLKTMKPPAPETPKIPCANGYEFEMTDIHYETVITERGWVCNEAKNVPTVHTMFFAGALLGGVIVGWLADNKGRIPALIASNLVGGLGGIATTMTTGLWDFCICRFICGLSFDSCFLIPYILTLEFVGPAHRTFVANMPLAIFYGIASVILPWIAYFVANWRILMWITHLPVLVVVAAPYVMPESVRWLISVGRIDSAVQVLKKIEKVNKSHIPEDVLEKFIASTQRVQKKKIVSFLSLFSSPLLRTTAILMVGVYSGGACLYDCIVRLTQMFGMNFFVAFTLNCAIEIPSLLVLTALLDRLGRRNLTAGSMFLATLFVVIAMFVPKGICKVSFGLAARFLLNMSFILMFQWSTELLPTPFRASGSTMLHIAGFAISLLSPFIVYLDKYSEAYPLIIVAVWTLLTAVLSMLLPETKGYEMPQTTADAEKIIVNETLWRKPEGVDKKISLAQMFQEPVTRSKAGRLSHLIIRSHSQIN